MKIILLDEKSFIKTIYNNAEVEWNLPSERIVKVEDDIAEDLSKKLLNYHIQYINGKFVYTDNGYTELKAIYDEINKIEEWFIFYDRQIAQYHRAERLGLPYDNRYGTVDELDAQAEIKAQRIAELRGKI